MEIPITPDVAVEGASGLTALVALMHTIWREIKLGRKFEKIDRKSEEMKKEINIKLDAVSDRLRGHDEEIEAHAIYDAKTYIPRDEFSGVIRNLDNKLDNKFDSLNTNIITAIRDGQKS